VRLALADALHLRRVQGPSGSQWLHEITHEIDYLLRSNYRERLEPVSKSFEEDNEAGKLDKAEEIVGVPSE
jgi:hypothetical protein